MAATCPRRMAELGSWERIEGLDGWSAGRGLIGQGQVGVSCTFCGSLHPDRFMELLREGWILSPTDKNYKAYLGRPLTDDERARRKATWLDSVTAREVRRVAEQDGKTPEQIAATLEESYQTVGSMSESSGQEAKFYYQHLSQEQRDEFIDLHNSRQLKIGYPGRLYVLPYFCARAAPQS